MNALPQNPSAEILHSHADWVRALARTLVRDPDQADDVAQDAWVDALQRPPHDARNLRGWMAQIVRNAARQESLPDTAELVAQAERQRALVGHVFSLDEPYRTTVLLRFFQGLDAHEIAARQSIPLATVRTRLCRFRADVRPEDPADELRVLDGDGRELRITTQGADGRFIPQAAKREGGSFPVCIVSDGAAMLVLYRGDVELRRVPVELHPSELQIVALP